MTDAARELRDKLMRESRLQERREGGDAILHGSGPEKPSGLQPAACGFRRPRCAWCATPLSGRRYSSCAAHRDLELALRQYYNGTMHPDPAAAKGTASR